MFLVLKHFKFPGDGQPQAVDSITAFKVQFQRECPDVVHARNLSLMTALQIACKT